MTNATYGNMRGHVRRNRGKVSAVTVGALVAGLISILTPEPAAAASSSCGSSVNAIVCENSQTAGVADPVTWDTVGAGADTLQGFSTDISVNAGNSIGFKIDTSLSGYTIDIYRLGYYGGHGARLWAGNVAHNAAVQQPACLTDQNTLLYDCGNWSLSATWNVPSSAVSGVYIAHLHSGNDDSQIPFVVRNDSSTSDIVYQTSDPSWQAYNLYGGSDFYKGTQQLTNSTSRAFKVSYNRPIITRGATAGRDYLFSNEYPTLRFMEKNGYDMSYISGIDTDRLGAAPLKNHKVFVSVGHDEYWSQAQRDNVESARDAGVNLMFLSGNEVYWRTRYENSIDGSNTAYRTLVCYKETWDNAPTDPSGASTATYRDPRFVDGKSGGNPENGLTGQMYRANADDMALTVSGAEGKNRFWRNTGLGSVADNATTSLAPHTVGYESDEVFDNGYSPAGLIKLSTTTGHTDQLLSDFGSTVAPGTTTHHLTLYRAASGALVFGAGTVQWGWGLDQYHDGDSSSSPDTRVQQATINMLADMNTLPSTLESDLVAASPSTDTQAPTSTITSPASGASLSNGSTITVSGTSADNGGGRVAGVEVSLDGGLTWHSANGTTSWSYTGTIWGSGASTIRVRATDDSVNSETPVQLPVNVSCPCSLFGNVTPGKADSGDSAAVEVGVRFAPTSDGYITGIRFYKSDNNTGTHVGTLWTSSGTSLATVTFTNETANGWQTAAFSAPVAVTAGTNYVASYYAPSGHYSADSSFFYYNNLPAPPLQAPPTRADGTTVNGLYNTKHAFPSATYKAANYYVDVTYADSATVPPGVSSQSPIADASSVALNVAPSAVFSKPMNASTVAISMKDSANANVAGTASFDSNANKLTFTPTAALAYGTKYTVTVTGNDTYGNPMTSPVVWSFTTVTQGPTDGTCPCSLFTDSKTPATITSNDAKAVELGVKFTADTDGVVTGVRFYKGPQNTGTHTGSLWTTSGTQLATATFGNESSTGWQTVTFSSPVSVTAGTTYIASYHTNVGYYSATSNAYASAGVDKFPLHAPAHASLFVYGTSAFPTKASDADYGVDVVFTVPSSTVPSATIDPADGSSNVGTSAVVRATFNTAVAAGSTSITVTPQGGSAVQGTLSLDSVQKVATFTPSASLAVGKTFTVTVSGAKSLGGVVMTQSNTTFTTSATQTCPCRLFPSNPVPATVDSNDASAVSVGTKFTSSIAGFVTGVRFFKATGNTGTHTGSLWSTSGTRLATVTFTNETASGWQSATFSQAVSVTAGTTYIVSYYAPAGHYSATGHFFDSTYTASPLSAAGPGNSVYKYGGDVMPTTSFNNTNYWVDVDFSTTNGNDTTPPTVSSTTPLSGSSSVSTSVAPTATFNEAVDPTSIVWTLTDSYGSAIPASPAYNANSRTATLTPNSALSRGVTYTVSIKAKDTSGNLMPNATSWSFTTAKPTPQAGVCPCSVWDDAATPTTITDPDTRSVELGVVFTADRNGQINGVRFYKGPNNTGTHTASLWTSGGTLLASGNTSSESTTGWQTVTFTNAVAITANTTYVVSYHATVGAFSSGGVSFASAGVDNPPLHVVVHGGRYKYGTGSLFPNTTSDTNYWVDPVFM